VVIFLMAAPVFSIPAPWVKLMPMIRQFRPEDAQCCSDLIQDCLRNDGDLQPQVRKRLLLSESAEAMRRRASLFYLAVCESADRIFGVAGLDMNELRLLYVSPEQQGRGYGSALLSHLEAMVPPALFADIFVYSVVSAAGFYRARGYRANGLCRFDLNGVYLETIFMTKPAR